MSAGMELARLLQEYGAAKRDELDAWAAMQGKLSALPCGAACDTSMSRELGRLQRAGIRRAAVEAQLSALMEGELEPVRPRDPSDAEPAAWMKLTQPSHHASHVS